MMLGRTARCAGAALGMFTALAACDRQTVDAAAQPYEIVTQLRPESPEVYMQMFRPAYDACALGRVVLHLPPPQPMVALPADFVMKRSTYLSSGSSSLIRHEEFTVDVNDMEPQTGCKTRIASSMTEVVVRGGQVYAQRRERDGHTEVDAPTPLSPNSSKGAAYTEKRTVGGIAMRCVSAATHGKEVTDRCAADTDTGLLRDGEGDPIVLYAREVVPGRNKMVVLTKPVSVQIGKPVSQERIAPSGAK